MATGAFSLLAWMPAAQAAPVAASAPVWARWQHSPVVIGLCLVALVAYLRGARVRALRGQALHPGKLAAFVFGVLLAYGALQSPLNALSPHLFWLNRVQSVALHDWVPLLMALAAPVPELLAGLPRPLGDVVVERLAPNPLLRGLWGLMQDAWVAPLLFLGMIVFWLTPDMLDHAVSNVAVYDVMHASMLVGGLFFWWFILAPHTLRASFGRRVITLWLVMLPQMLLGFYVMFTGRALYPAFMAQHGNWPVSYMLDQNLGGMLIWIPVIMTSALAAILVLRFWMRQERGLLTPASDAEPVPSVATLPLVDQRGDQTVNP